MLFPWAISPFFFNVMSVSPSSIIHSSAWANTLYNKTTPIRQQCRIIDKINPKEIHKDPKTILQEFLQAQKVPLPVYEVIHVEGEAHDQLFSVSCSVSKFDIKAEGGGRSRKIAEQEAAKEAMATIEKSLYGIV